VDTASITALPPVAATGSKLAARIVITFFASLGVHDVSDIADRLHIQQRRQPRHHVLARRSAGRHQVPVVPGHADQQRRQRLRQRMLIHRTVGHMDLRHAGQLGRSLRRTPNPMPGHEHVHLTQLRRGRDGAARRLLDPSRIPIQQNERCHL